MLTRIALLLILIPSSACNNSSPTALDGAALSFETIVQSSYSGFTEPQTQAVRDVGEWNEVWQTLYAGQSPVPPLPAVNFGRESVILAAAGARSNGCYSIEITRATLTRTGTVEFQVTETVPGPTCICTQAITQPTHLVRLSAVPTKETFALRQAQLAC